MVALISDMTMTIKYRFLNISRKSWECGISKRGLVYDVARKNKPFPFHIFCFIDHKNFMYLSVSQIV